jgi:hypothetical protein
MTLAPVSSFVILSKAYSELNYMKATSESQRNCTRDVLIDSVYTLWYSENRFQSIIGGAR